MTAKYKMWYSSKTVWFNVLGLVVVVAQYLMDQKLVDPAVLESVLLVTNVALRLVSNTPVEKKLM